MRARILDLLRQEGAVSGEDLAQRLGISRTAVWKHVAALRKLGYRVASAPHAGYTYLGETDMLLPETLSAGLATRRLGRRIVHHHRLTSTQDLAEEMARAGAEEGTVVVAEHQTQGRGRRRRAWASPPQGGIYLSLILRPELRPSQVSQVPLLAGVAACRAVRGLTGLRPAIKWPNDIMLNGRKAGGILTEMACEIDRINYLVLGIGLNVNTPPLALPAPVRPVATSLAAEGGRELSRTALVRLLLTQLEDVYSCFVRRGFDSIREEWRSLDCTAGARVYVSDAAGTISGVAEDVDGDGYLLVRKEDGTIQRIVAADVTLASSERRS